MPIFVHLAPARDAESIRRRGIDPRRASRKSPGVFAMPVAPDFQRTHQWIREIRRFGRGSLIAVYFRIPDAEPVLAGHYAMRKQPATAAQAAAYLMGRAPATLAARLTPPPRTAGFRPEEPHQGFEVVIPRRIEASEIVRIKPAANVVGWRFVPGSNGQKPVVCRCCCKGEYGIQKRFRAMDAKAGD